MCDPITKRGVLNDFDLARLRSTKGKPSGKDNTGTMPFLALDLLNEKAFKGLVPRLYRHDAESFAWCLVYICICMAKDKDGQIRVISPHPLTSWFVDPYSCLGSKLGGSTAELLARVPLHSRSQKLAVVLYRHWLTRYHQTKVHDLTLLDHDANAEPEGGDEDKDEAVRRRNPYAGPEDGESFKRIFMLIRGSEGAVPTSREGDFHQLSELVTTLYLFDN